MGLSTVKKVFHNVKIQFKDSTKAGTVEFYMDDVKVTSGLTEKTDDNEVTYKFKTPFKKAKRLQIRIIDCKTEVDSIGIIFKPKRVK
jgi:elongation factor P--beta-lysine ligase